MSVDTKPKKEKKEEAKQYMSTNKSRFIRIILNVLIVAAVVLFVTGNNLYAWMIFGLGFLLLLFTGRLVEKRKQ